jgi:hypothetical protein
METPVEETEEQARERRRKARANWPVRKGTVEELETDDPLWDPSEYDEDPEYEARVAQMTLEERFGEVWRLTKEAWFRKTGVWLED